MKVFVAGATGAIGKQLVPMLVQRGHEVTGMTRTPAKQDQIRQMGGRPVVADALDPEAVAQAVAEAEPEVVIHELTAIDTGSVSRNIDKAFAQTNRLRTDGTDHLLTAAKTAGARRFIVQSFAGWPFERCGDPVKPEEAPLQASPPKNISQTLAVNPDGEQNEMIRKRRLPVVGGGTGIWSLVHIHDAASATVAALDRGEPDIYNVVDDDPVPVSDLLLELAKVIDAKPPRRVPRWLGRLVAGEAATVMMTEVRGAANAKAKRELGWELRYPSWRQGIREGLG